MQGPCYSLCPLAAVGVAEGVPSLISAKPITHITVLLSILNIGLVYFVKVQIGFWEQCASTAAYIYIANLSHELQRGLS